MGKQVGKSREDSEKMDYMKRWAKTHPRVVVYFDLADYEHVRKRADELGLTISEFIKRAVKGGLVGEYERGFYEGYRAGLRDGHYSELVARFGEPALELIVDLRRDEKLRKVKLAILEGIIKFCSEARGGGGEHVINKICVIDSAIDGFRRAGIELEGRLLRRKQLLRGALRITSISWSGLACLRPLFLVRMLHTH
ncbi:hypothetical protein [Vulcanisaeta distributa]|uniref:hypothetical protein n=1 Tax=Vulcanisaeta distributa TaxID=164451 RepID=UPI0006D230BF|nr:hypothetical protein [Vulcanisaeta distributa]